MMTAHPTQATEDLRAARDFLLEHRDDYARRRREFRLAAAAHLQLGSGMVRRHRRRSAPPSRLWSSSRRTGPAGRWTLRRAVPPVGSGRRLAAARTGSSAVDRIVLMLGNQVELWEIVLAAIKLGAVIIPASTLLTPTDLADRVLRGGARFVIARDVDADVVPARARHVPADRGRPAGRGLDRVRRHARTSRPRTSSRTGSARAADPLLLYFTSGTTALPKLVEHSQISYPIGHLTTMYWIGLRPGDVHLNISSPGWAKHAWSNVFAPWLAGATVLVHNYARFDAVALMRVHGRAPGVDVLRPADGLADADPGRSVRCWPPRRGRWSAPASR